MAFESLQAVVGTAVIDSEFRAALLNGPRRAAVSDFGLTPEEMNVVLAIHAATLEQFAGQVDQWIARKLHRVEPPELVLPTDQPLNPGEIAARQEPAPMDNSLLPLFVS